MSDKDALLLRPEDDGSNVPDVYRSLNFKSVQDPYSHGRDDDMISRYSTIRAENLDVMLTGGLERFYKKYNHLSRKVNLALPTPEVRFENLSFAAEVPLPKKASDQGTVGHYLGKIFTPWLAISPAEFSTLFHQSSIYRATHAALSKGYDENKFENPDDFKKAKSAASLVRTKGQSEFGLAFLPSTLLLLNRQKTIWLRDRPLLWGKLFEALVVGLVLGVLYFDCDPKYYLRMMFFSIGFTDSHYINAKGIDTGRAKLLSFSIKQGKEYLWFGIGVLVAYYFLFTTLNALALHYIRYERHLGVTGKATKTDDDDDDSGDVPGDNVYVEENRARTLALCDPPAAFVRFSTMNFDPIATPFWHQLTHLARKQRRTYWRSPQYNFMRLFLFPIFALETNSLKKINSHIGLIYNSMDFIGVLNLMTVLEITCAERAVFYRERMSNYYGPLPYSLSFFFAELPYLLVVIALFVSIEYWLVGWRHDAGAFAFFLLAFYLYTSVCTFIGQWMSVLMPNAKVANVAVGAISCLLNLFGGYLLPRPEMKAWYRWIQYVMPSSYSLPALVGGLFGDSAILVTVERAGVASNMTVAKYIEAEYDFRPDAKWAFVAGLLGFWAVVQLAIYLTLKYVSHLKR
ncbi:hypothetical protein PybrP1_000164 [[Pythium] brassicae (nom. inval.)]|nr:hypothetical protein PybrP1_000164 [[Pythium] brassicae (nom. inval.)]